MKIIYNSELECKVETDLYIVLHGKVTSDCAEAVEIQHNLQGLGIHADPISKIGAVFWATRNRIERKLFKDKKHGR